MNPSGINEDHQLAFNLLKLLHRYMTITCDEFYLDVWVVHRFLCLLCLVSGYTTTAIQNSNLLSLSVRGVAGEAQLSCFL